MKKLLAILAVLVFSLAPVMAEKIYKLDAAIETVAKTLSAKLPQGTKVVVLDIKAEKPEASAYIVEELTFALLEIGKLVVVDRENLEAIRAELSLQTSGDVSDESAQRLGAMLGAQTLISGSFDLLRDKYRFTTKAVKVETSEIQYLSALSVAATADTEALFGRKSAASSAASAAGKAVRGVADFTGRLICSSINPFVGIGSFIQGDSDGGSTVVFLGALAWGKYRSDEGLSNSEFLMVGGAVSVVGAVIYSWIRPWTYNRNPQVTEVLDNVRISQTADNDVSLGYVIRY